MQEEEGEMVPWLPEFEGLGFACLLACLRLRWGTDPVVMKFSFYFFFFFAQREYMAGLDFGRPRT